MQNNRNKDSCADLTKQLVEAAVAVGFVVLLLERALVQLLQAEGTDKVLRVEFAEHGGDAAPSDGLWAARAQGASLRVVVRLAVRQALVIKEWTALERKATVLQRMKRQTVLVGQEFYIVI